MSHASATTNSAAGRYRVRWRLAQSTSVVVGLVALLVANPAVAVAACIPNRPAAADYEWEGYDGGLTTNATLGLRSTIKTYRPYVPCGGFSYSWVMLTDPGDYKWAQLGPYEACEGNVMYAQWANGTAASVAGAEWSAGVDNADHRYSVRYLQGTPPLFRFWRDGVNILNVQTNWTPNAAQISSEIWLHQTQFMGQSTNYQHFLDNERLVGTVWSPFTGSLVNSSLAGHAGNAADFTTWDTCT